MIAAPLELPIHLRHLSIKAAQQQGGQKIKFVNPNTDNYDRNLRHAGELHKHGIPCYKQNMLRSSPDDKGPVVVVAGSGPTLNDPDVLAAIKAHVEAGALLFACKAAIKLLHDEGLKIDYAVTMDPGAHIANPKKIYKSPDTVHLVASSSDPLLFDYLLMDTPFADWLEELTEEERKKVLAEDSDAYEAGEFVPPDAGEGSAHVMIFHSATGYPKEVPLYNELFETPDCMGGGYNVVNRAVSAALFMGANKLVLAGTDCGWRQDEEMYADGPAHRSGVDMSDNGMVDGTPWMTRPDMLASGVALAKLAKKMPDRFEFLGDTLPSKLVHKDDKFLNQCASFGQ